MDFLKKNKTITAVAILAIFILLYFVFFSSSGTASLSSSDATTDSPVSQSLLVTLSSLKTIRLDGSVFSDPVFVSLTDFGVVIPPEPSGRRDPFLPAGTDGTAPAGNAPATH